MESGYRNMTETAIAEKVIEGLHDHLKLKRDHIGVIAPYRAQIKTLSDMLPSDVEVDTVDKFQGKFQNRTKVRTCKCVGCVSPPIIDKPTHLAMHFGAIIIIKPCEDP